MQRCVCAYLLCNRSAVVRCGLRRIVFVERVRDSQKKKILLFLFFVIIPTWYVFYDTRPACFCVHEPFVLLHNLNRCV